MFDLIIASLYFILPAYVANMFPVFAGALRLPFGTAIHANIFGKNKTWRGLYSAYVGALIVLFVQMYLDVWDVYSGILEITYQNIFLYAFCFGIGAMIGDMVGSFIKRRLNIGDGRPMVFVDQLDFIVGALVFLYPFYIPETNIVIVLVVLTPVLHLLSNVFAYAIGIKKVWW